MSRILLDGNVPVGLPRLLGGHEIRTAYRMGWAQLSNGELLAIAETAGFSVMITCDQNIRHQQNLSGRKIALVVLSTNDWDVLRANAERIVAAIERAGAGGYEEVRFPSLIRPRPKA